MTDASPPLVMSTDTLSLKKVSGTPDGTAQSTPTLNNITLTNDKLKQNNNVSRRIEVDKLVTELQKKMGSNWDKYQRTISLFLLGKLSRQEFLNILNPLLTDSKMIRMHNQLLLANLANSLRDGPNQQMSKKSGFGSNSSNKKKKDSKVKVSSQYEKLKKNIMNLPIRERYRIKTITRDSGKRNMSTSSMTLTRQALLPKIPYVSDKDRVISGNTVEWTQDISHSLQTPLASESYSLPDADTLESKMLGIAREHGLTGSIDKSVFDLVSLGLENYLKYILESTIDTVRYRKRKYADSNFNPIDSANEPKKAQKVILTNEDVSDTLRISPYLIEPNGPLYRLNTVMLNDDCHVEEKTPVDSFLKHPRPTDSVNSSISPLITSKSIPSSITKESTNTLSKDGLPSSGDTTISKEPTSSSTFGSNNDPNVKKEAATNGGNIDSNTSDSASASGAKPPANLENSGTKEELNWLIYDILTAK